MRAERADLEGRYRVAEIITGLAGEAKCRMLSIGPVDLQRVGDVVANESETITAPQGLRCWPGCR